jgi:hypothetical protein
MRFLASGPMTTSTSQRTNTSIQERGGLFWVRHEHLFPAKNRQNCKFYNRLTTKDMLRVFIGSSRTSSQLRGRRYTGPPSTITEGSRWRLPGRQRPSSGSSGLRSSIVSSCEARCFHPRGRRTGTSDLPILRPYQAPV